MTIRPATQTIGSQPTIEVAADVPFFHPIKVNGLPFLPIATTSERTIYAPERESDVAKLGRIIFVQALVDEEVAGFLPHRILVNGQPWVRIFERFYLPKKRTELHVASFFDLIAENYERYIERELNELIISELLRVGARRLKRTPKEILDYGVGTGLSVPIVRRVFSREPVKLHGADVSAEMLKKAAKAGIGIHLRHVRNSQIPMPSNKIDLALLSFVVHYFVDGRPFGEIFRVLRPGGLIAFNLHKFERDEAFRYLQRLRSSGYIDLLEAKFKTDAGEHPHRTVILSAFKPSA